MGFVRCRFASDTFWLTIYLLIDVRLFLKLMKLDRDIGGEPRDDQFLLCHVYQYINMSKELSTWTL